MSTTKSRAAIALLAVVALFLGACGSSDETTEATGESAPANSDLQGELTIGAIFPTTGDTASLGQDQARGAELAAEKVNSEDGVLGKKLTISVEDTQSDTVAAVQAARKLVNVDDVPVVIGEVISARTIAAGKFLQKSGVVQINPGSSSTDIASIGDFSFSSIALDNVAGTFAAETLYNAGYRSIAFLGPNNPYGSDQADALSTKFEELGGKVVESILYSEGETTYRAELGRLQDSGAEMIVYTSYPPDTVTINKEAFELGIPASMFYGNYLSVGISEVDPVATAGQLGEDLTFEGPISKEFVDAYEAKYGEPPATPYSAYVYDATLMAAAAINEADSEDPAAIRDAMASIGTSDGFEGSTGMIKLDDDGQRTEQKYGLFEVDDKGKLQEIDSIPGPE